MANVVLAMGISFWHSGKSLLPPGQAGWRVQFDGFEVCSWSVVIPLGLAQRKSVLHHWGHATASKTARSFQMSTSIPEC